MEDETKVQIHVIQFFQFCFQQVELKENVTPSSECMHLL